MKILNINSFAFKAMPKNYAKIDKTLSRSAQPEKEDFAWLKSQGVTDIINFRTMAFSNINFDEENEVKALGMNYHNIPTVTMKPNEKKVQSFLDLVEEIKKNGGIAHIHCKAGADRTGMYAFIYKMIKGIGTLAENEKEWIALGHDTKLFPNLRNWAKDFVKKF